MEYSDQKIANVDSKQLSKLERQRRCLRWLARIHWLVIVVIIGEIAMPLLGYGTGLDFSLVLFCVAYLVFHKVYFAKEIRSCYSNSYKQLVVNSLLGETGEDILFQTKSGEQGIDIAASQLFNPVPDRIKASDLVSGVFHKTQFHFSRVKAEERRVRRREGKKQVYYRPVFTGFFFVADFHKHFDGRTFIYPDNIEKKIGGLARKIQGSSRPHGTKLVHLDDAEFENEFAVYSTGEVECRYILSPLIMRRILDLKQRFQIEDMRIAFNDSHIYIALPNRWPRLDPFFERPASDEDQFTRIKRELTIYLDIIDQLQLNTRIWLKE